MTAVGDDTTPKGLMSRITYMVKLELPCTGKSIRPRTCMPHIHTDRVDGGSPCQAISTLLPGQSDTAYLLSCLRSLLPSSSSSHPLPQANFSRFLRILRVERCVGGCLNSYYSPVQVGDRKGAREP